MECGADPFGSLAGPGGTTRLKFEIVSVFGASQAGGGNQLLVVMDTDEILSDAQRRGIAREIGFSESIFIGPLVVVGPQQQGGEERSVRILTTDGTEVPFAGHPLIGAAAVLDPELRARRFRLMDGSTVDVQPVCSPHQTLCVPGLLYHKHPLPCSGS